MRTDGLDSHAGTGAAAANAWQTIGKALGAAGIASGDTVYIAPGTYREVVTCNLTSPTVETFVIGDVSASKFTDVQGGDVIWTAYTTNDKTSPSTSTLLTLNGCDHLTFTDLLLVGGNNGTASCIDFGSSSTDIKLLRCAFSPGRGAGSPGIAATATVDVANNWTFDTCFFLAGVGGWTSITLPTSTVADYDAEIIFRNCLVAYGYSDFVRVNSSGANSFKGGGVKIYNSTVLCSPASSAVLVNGANIASSAGSQCEVYNSLVYGTLNASTLGQIVEDYNYIVASTPRTNVSVGANSQASGTSAVLPYAMLVHLGQERLYGQYMRPYFSPMLQSPLLGFGNDGSIGVQTTDAFGVPRPAGPARTWANALKGIGYSERPNTAAREATTVRTGTYAIKLLGPSVQDVEIPVAAASTTVTVYARYDSAYGAGTLPRMRVLANAECGVVEATATAVGAANAWEQLSLNFTPTATGVVTVRFMSDGDGDGSAFFDDFAVA